MITAPMKSNYTFLVLMDFSEASYISLKYSISLAKYLGARIEIFHAIDPEKISGLENSQAFLSSLDQVNKEVENKLKSLVEMLDTEGIQSSSNYSYGKIRSEINTHVLKIKPDLVIVGSNTKNAKGRIMNHFLNTYSGNVLITKSDGEFDLETNISFACKETTIKNANLEIVNALDKLVDSSLSIIKVNSNQSNDAIIEPPLGVQLLEKPESELRFHAPNNASVADGLINHIAKDEIGLICICRSKNNSRGLCKIFSKRSTSTELVKSVIDIPILLLGNRN